VGCPALNCERLRVYCELNFRSRRWYGSGKYGVRDWRWATVKGGKVNGRAGGLVRPLPYGKLLRQIQGGGEMKINSVSGVLIVCCMAFALNTGVALGRQSSDAQKTSAPSASALRDGQHDFDFELGSWKIHLKRLVNPLTGSKTWVEFDGTSVTRKVWDGRAQIEEFETDGSAGHIEGLTLRLYNPQAHQWSLYWGTSKSGTLGVPTIGEFKNGRGEFYDQEEINGRTILVRFIWSEITANSAHFEQSFSDDGGKTWEVNWITDQTRVNGDGAKAQ